MSFNSLTKTPSASGIVPLAVVPAREWQVMHEEVLTKPASVTELPRWVGCPVESVNSVCDPFIR
ncbi:hypothetical protein [Hyalangium sp.]|uniref:hypothetical protein n=1 Tax=Hyalangium sp. TaxID=2028555 RepID=UPI0039C8A2A5